MLSPAGSSPSSSTSDSACRCPSRLIGDRSRCKRESFIGEAFKEDPFLVVVLKLLTSFDPLWRLEVEASPGSDVDGSERAPATVSVSESNNLEISILSTRSILGSASKAAVAVA